MADVSQSGTLKIPDEVLQKFPDLVELIKGSESMNDEERQYWVNILPIMTPDQVQNLRDILDNEKKQLAAIDDKYRSDAPVSTPASPVNEDERRKRREDRQSKEASHKEEEDKKAEELLRSMEDAGTANP